MAAGGQECHIHISELGSRLQDSTVSASEYSMFPEQRRFPFPLEQAGRLSGASGKESVKMGTIHSHELTCVCDMLVTANKPKLIITLSLACKSVGMSGKTFQLCSRD